MQIPSGHEKALLIKDPLALVDTLNKLGGQHGVGRIDIVENRFLGLKVHYPYSTTVNISENMVALHFVIRICNSCFLLLFVQMNYYCSVNVSLLFIFCF